MTADRGGADPKQGGHNKRWWILALVGLLAFGFYQFNSGLNHLFSAITGQSSIGISDSMEPYELVFRTDWSPSEHGKVPRREWALNIPRAFLTDLIGSNGNTGPDAGFYALLEAVFDPDTKEFLPIAQADRSKMKDFAIGFNLGNDNAMPQLLQTNACLREDDFRSFMKTFGQDERNRACGTHFQRCGVLMHVDGWGLRLSVPRLLYGNPQPVCDAVKNFLGKYTVKRDPLS
jgi:hypothetical protein